MPIYLLNNEIIFPHPSHSTKDGVLAVGGDLSVERLVLAYKQGIFPWYSEGEPIIWWSPDPRFVLFPDQLKVSKSMRQVLRKNQFTVTYDEDFRAVISECKDSRTEIGTWITTAMKEAYCRLHEAGFAHSVEVRQAGELVAGLYGVSLGRCFFGESMFTKVSNASKVAFIHLTRELQARGFWMIDCQQETNHLGTLGAECIPRSVFLEILDRNFREPTLKGKWDFS